MKPYKRGSARGLSPSGMLLAILALLVFIWILPRGKNSFPWGQTSNTASIAEAFCLGSISRCNSVRLPNATVCNLLQNALQFPSTAPPLCSGGSSIPHIIHQSWKIKELPKHFSMWSQSWKDHHPDWEYKFWTDDDNRNLVKRHFPWVLETYDAFTHPIMRADTVRYMYMHYFGGLYADLDTWAMRNIENLTTSMSECRGEEAVVAMMSDDVDFEHNIPNAWMASSPGHPFWIFLVQVVQERFKLAVHLQKKHDQDKTNANNKSKSNLEENDEKSNDDDDDGDQKKIDDDDDIGAEVATGPVVLKEAYDTWKCMLGEQGARMRTIPAGYVFLSDWHDDDAREFFDVVCNSTNIILPKVQRQCLRAFPNAHVATFWAHSWETPWWEKEEYLQKEGGRKRGRMGRGRRGKQEQSPAEE